MQHYTKNTTAVSLFCSTCGKKTMHRVADKRVGTCLEHGKEGLSKSQERARKEREEAEDNPTLF